MRQLTLEEVYYILSNLGIEVKEKNGRLYTHCPNPNHEDSNPSWSMENKPPYRHNCFSCNFKGNIYNLPKFLGRRLSEFVDLNTEYTEQFKKVKENNIVQKGKFVIKGQMYDVSINPEVKKYCESIHMSNSFINKFKVKFMLNGEINKTTMYRRLITPITIKNKIVNYEARDYTGRSKKKIIYPTDSIADVLWNFDNIDLSKPVVIVEGIKGALRIWEYFTKNVIATLGSKIGYNQRELIKTIPEVILFPDTDKAGAKMFRDFKLFYPRNFKATFMKKKGYDPADGNLKNLCQALDNARDWRRITNINGTILI